MVIVVVERERRPWVHMSSDRGMRDIRMGWMSLLLVLMLLTMEVRELVVMVRLCGTRRNGDWAIPGMRARTSSILSVQSCYSHEETYRR